MTTTPTPTSGAADMLAMVSKALREAYSLGQRYWQQADSEYISRHKKADGTRAKFLALVEETCATLAAGQATAAPAQPAAQQGVAYAALPTSSHAGRVYEEGFLVGTCPLYTADKLRAFADATHALRASHGQAPAKPDPAYSAACNLATALFKKHFAHLPDFASGQAVWSLCDSTAGVISQIDNMVAGLVQPPTTSPQAAQAADSVLEDAARYRWLRDQAHPDSEDSGIAVSESDFNDWGNKFTRYYSGEELDAAIDAARKQGEKQ